MLTLLSMSAFAQDAPTYKVDTNSWLAVLVSYDRSALGGGHDHVVTPNQVNGSVTFDPAAPASCDIKLSFPVTALQVDPEGSRKRFSLDGETSDGDKGSIKKNLEGKHQLQASSFPEITFQSSSCAGEGESFTVTGKVTIHGVAKEVTSKMKITADGSKFKATGGFNATHDDFGFKPFSALLGALRNDQKLKFQIAVTGTK